MKLVVNVISLFFSDKSVPIDGYQGNTNPIFISILSPHYVLYIFRILVFRKFLLKNLVFRDCSSNPGSLFISGIVEVSVKPDFSKRATTQSICQLQPQYSAILRNIVNISLVCASLTYVFLFTLFTWNGYCDAKCIYNIFRIFLKCLNDFKLQLDLNFNYEREEIRISIIQCSWAWILMRILLFHFDARHIKVCSIILEIFCINCICYKVAFCFGNQLHLEKIFGVEKIHRQMRIEFSHS